MKKTTLVMVLSIFIALLPVVVTGCGNNEETSSVITGEYIYADSEISPEKQKEIEQILETWAYAYTTHYLLIYNECVGENLEYTDNSTKSVPHTENYFDTVTDCKITNIDFKQAKITDEKVYSIPVSYTITYNDKFKEENGLKKGKNSLSVLMSVKENGVGEFYIDEIISNTKN
ncbi:MAG: hypothetical protein UIM53_00680 [Acutalibacteraceae bacterium]|nr:hypothetical protein [Acutalibacteraceae bacterium]